MSSTYSNTLDRLLKDPNYNGHSYRSLTDIARRQADRIDSQSYLYYAGRPQTFVTGLDYAAFERALSKPIAPVKPKPEPLKVGDYAKVVRTSEHLPLPKVGALVKVVGIRAEGRYTEVADISTGEVFGQPGGWYTNRFEKVTLDTDLQVGDVVEVVQPRERLRLGQKAQVASIIAKKDNGTTAFVTLKTTIYGDNISNGEAFYASRVKKYVKPVVLNTTDLKVGDLVEVINSGMLGNGKRVLITEVKQPTAAGVTALVKVASLATGLDATGYSEFFHATRFKKVEHLKAEKGAKIRVTRNLFGFVTGKAYPIESVRADGSIVASGSTAGSVGLFKGEFIVIEEKPKPALVTEIPVGSIVFGGDWKALDALPNGSAILNVTSGSKSPIVKANGDWHMVYTDGKGKVQVNYFVSDKARKFSLLHYGTTGNGAQTTRTI